MARPEDEIAVDEFLARCRCQTDAVSGLYEVRGRSAFQLP